MWEIKLKDGLYLQERVTDDLTGDQRIISAKIKGESRAERKRAKEKLEQKLIQRAPKKDKLSDLINLYMKTQEPVLKTASYMVYEGNYKNALATVGDIYLDKLTAGLIKKRLLDSGKDYQTCNTYIARLKACLKWAYMNDIIDDASVYQKLAMFPVRPERVKIRDKFLEPEELKTLIDMTPPSLSLWVRFLSLTGLRVGEAIALENSDIWGDEIHITKTFSDHARVISTPKTIDSYREIHIQPELKECIKDIQEYMKWQQETYNYAPVPYLFVSPSGERVKYGTLEGHLKSAGKRLLGRNNITCHVLRHTHASLLAAAGYPLEAISRRLGHGDSAITKAIYLHQTERLKIKEASMLDKITLLEKFA